MDATQAISDSILESDEEEHEEENRNKRGRPLAKLCILKNPHIPETELPLFLGDNILGRDPNICTHSLASSSVSKQHATICISAFRRRGGHRDVDMETLVWDLGSMNGTRKGRLKLTPNVRYALSEGDSLVFADIPCQYVGCGGVSSQDDMKTPESRRFGVKGMLSDALDENSDTSSKNGVSGGEKAKKTHVRGGCLSFEQTPTQPEGSLVPESDSDSEGDGGGGRQHKTQVSDSDSHKSSPNSSAFLSPPNKIVPESEDEGPMITPLSSSRSSRHVSFSTEKTDVHMERNKSPTFVENSDEEEKRTAQGETNSKEIDQHMKQKNNVSFTREDESPVSTSEVSRGAIPEFNMDSDTDVEGEEEEVVAAPPRPLSMNTSQHADQPPNTVDFNMDSDTDIDEEDEKISDKPSKTSSDETTKPSHVASGIQSEGITMDSDTDVDDDVAVAVSDAVITAKTSSCQDAHIADSTSSVQPKDFHLDSDTDVDEEDEGDCGMKNNSSKTNKACIKTDVKPAVPECIPAAPQNLHPDTDTSNEAICVPAAGGPSVASAVAESCITAAAGADLDILSDSDSEMEDDCHLGIPLTVTDLSVVPGKTSEALESDSDEDTDVDEPCLPPVGDIPGDLRVDSDTDEEDSIEEAGEDQIPDLQREHTVGSLVPALQNCSTPVQVSEEVEDMETQAFTSPSSGAFRHSGVSTLKPAVLSSLSDSQEDEDLAVAETQSFVLQNRDQQADMDPNTASASDSKAADRSSRGDSFQLGLSDSSHLQSHSVALAMESTQAFVLAEGGVNLEETQAYEAISTLEATQPYEEDEEPVRDSEVSEKEGCVNLAFEATQVFISQPYSDSNEDSDEAKTQNAAMTETTDLTDHSSTLAMAKTQPVPPFEEEQSLETNNPTCSVHHVESRILNEAEEKEAQQRHLFVAETQPMCTSDNLEGYDEDLLTPSRLQEEQTQPNTCSALSLAETQPMNVEETQPVVLSENDEDSMPLLRKRKAKQLHIEEEESQKLTPSGVYTAETQPIAVSEDDDDDNDSMPGPRKRKAKPLQLEDETQPLVISEVSAFDSQPLATCEDEQSDEEDFILHSKKRKARPLQLEEEQTQPLISSEVSGSTARVEDGGEENNSEVLVPRKRKAKQLHLEEEETQQLMNSELSAAETQPPCEGEEVDMMEGPLMGETNPLQPEKEPVTTDVSDVDGSDHKGSIIAKQQNLKEEELQLLNSDVSPGETLFKTKAAETSEPSAANSRQTRARLREKEEEAECSAPPKRQTRRENKTLPSTRGGRGKAMTHHDNDEDEVKQSKQTGGRKSTRWHDDKEDNGKIIVTKSLIKEQKHRNLEEEGDTAKFREEKTEMTENKRIETGVRTRKRKETEQRNEGELQNEGKTTEKQDCDLEEVGGDGEEVKEKQGLKKKKKEQMEMKKEGSEESLETAQRKLKERPERGKKEQEHQARPEKEKQPEVSQDKDEEEKQKVPARGRRSTRKTAQCTTEPEQNSAVSASDDFPSSRTRSRSNSSNSVSSERSVSGVNTQEARGRGMKRSSETPQPLVIRSSRRRVTAAGPTEPDSEDGRFRSNSSSSEISTCSGSSQNRARGGRRQGRGRKAYSDRHVVAPFMIDIDQHPTEKGGKKEMAEGPSSEADALQFGTSRGQQQVNANDKGRSCQEKEEKSLLQERNARSRGQNAVKTENMEEPVVPPVSDGHDARNKKKGRMSELEVNTKADGSNVIRGKTLKTTEGKNEQKEETPVQARRTSRVSSAQVKKNATESPPKEEVEDGENMEVNAAEKKARGRTSVFQKNKKEQKEIRTSASSTKQDTNEASEEPHTPTSTVSRKRQASSDSSPAAKTPRSSSGSPAAVSRLRAGSQSYKVLFTGVVDETGERVLARLGGSMAKGVADMNCLVTDKVRRTVKFLCAVAKGIPVVTPEWLEKSGKAGSFLSPNDFVVKDPEQEKKFSFCLQESLRTSRSQPLLQGYEIHVTKSVKPEPVHMKDIISCSGATFLPRMPSSCKPQTVVISCEEDWRLCGSAVSASLPIVTAEFILTGILQQKLDFHTHALSSSTTASSQPAEDRGRTRRKT